MRSVLSTPIHIPEIKSLASIADSYDLYLIDVIGVIHNGLDPYKDAVDCVNHLISNKKTVVFLSNNPRPGKLTKEKLLSFGIKSPFEVLTSGDVARKLLSTQFKNKKIYHLGAERNEDITQELDLQITENINQADLVLLTAFLEPNESSSKHDAILKEILRLNLPVLCANPDKIAIHGNAIRQCAGALADRLISQGGTVIYSGKPAKAIFELLPSFFPHIHFDKSRMLMIGDSLETDIKGANQFGIDSLLVLSGNTGNDLKKENTTLESFVKGNHAISPIPTFYMKHLC